MTSREQSRDFFDGTLFGSSVVYLCDWLPPDFGAVGQYALLRAEALARGGRAVALYGLSSTSAEAQTRPCGDGRLKVVRLASGPVPKGRLVSRLIWTMKTNARLVAASFADLRNADTVVFTGAPPFLLHLLVPVNAVLRRRLVYRITDFHPECLMAGLRRTPWSLRLFHRLTLWLRRRVDGFEVLGEDQREKLAGFGIDPARIALVRDPSPVTVTGEERPLPAPAGLRDYAILLYSGNLGVAHDIDTFVAGYALHHARGTGRVGLWLNAVGSKVDELSRALAERKLPFHRSALVPLDSLASLMVSPRAHLITLAAGFEGLVVPSKTYACLDSRRDVLFIGSRRSDVHRLCAAGLPAGRYHHVPLGDAEGVAKALEAIAEAAER